MAGIDLDALSPAMTAAATLSNLILVSPQREVGYQPQDDDGFAEGDPILFHHEGEQSAILESDITDHYIEDNTAINDQIALRPESITVHGVVGEINNVTPEKLRILKVAAEKLSVISAYTPALSATAIAVYNQAEQVYNTALTVKKSGVAAWQSLNKTGTLNEISSNGLRDDEPSESQTIQQVYFQQFYGHWRNRKLFTVQTPWAIFNNMAIKSLRAIQSQDSLVITDFEITFKMIRIAKTTNDGVLYSENSAAGRSGNQKSGAVNMGAQTPTPSISMSSAVA